MHSADMLLNSIDRQVCCPQSWPLALHRSWGQMLAWLWQAEGRESSDVAPATKALSLVTADLAPISQQVVMCLQLEDTEWALVHKGTLKIIVWHESEALLSLLQGQICRWQCPPNIPKTLDIDAWSSVETWKADVLTLPLMPCSHSSSAKHDLGLASSCLIWIVPTLSYSSSFPVNYPGNWGPNSLNYCASMIR